MKANCHFFSNRDCEYFPCHEVSGEEQKLFNCMFCYCPLYTLGEDCGGDFVYTDTGVKDCSECVLPHRPDAFERILSRWDALKLMACRKQNGGDVVSFLFQELTQEEIIEIREGDAYRDGMEAGMEAGIAKGTEKIAKKLKAEGIDFEIIAKTTGLSIEEIDKL